MNTVCNLPASGHRSSTYLVAGDRLPQNVCGHKKLSKLSDIASFQNFRSGRLYLSAKTGQVSAQNAQTMLREFWWGNPLLFSQNSRSAARFMYTLTQDEQVNCLQGSFVDPDFV